MNETPAVIVGIDVSKAMLDVAVRPGGSLGHFTNDEVGGIDALVARMIAFATLDCTGSHRRIRDGIGLSAGGGWVARGCGHPRQVRDFAKATGQLAKTDALDTDILAHFGEVIRPAVRTVKTRRSKGLPHW